MDEETAALIDATGPLTCIALFLHWRDCLSDTTHPARDIMNPDVSVTEALLLPSRVSYSGSRLGEIFKSRFPASALAYPERLKKLHGKAVTPGFLHYFRDCLATRWVTPLPLVDLENVGAKDILDNVNIGLRALLDRYNNNFFEIYRYIEDIKAPAMVFIVDNTPEWTAFWTLATHTRARRQECGPRMAPVPGVTRVVDLNSRLEEVQCHIADPLELAEFHRNQKMSGAEHWLMTSRSVFLVLFLMWAQGIDSKKLLCMSDPVSNSAHNGTATTATTATTTTTTTASKRVYRRPSSHFSSKRSAVQ